MQKNNFMFMNLIILCIHITIIPIAVTVLLILVIPAWFILEFWRAKYFYHIGLMQNYRVVST